MYGMYPPPWVPRGNEQYSDGISVCRYALIERTAGRKGWYSVSHREIFYFFPSETGRKWHDCQDCHDSNMKRRKTMESQQHQDISGSWVRKVCWNSASIRRLHESFQLCKWLARVRSQFSGKLDTLLIPHWGNDVCKTSSFREVWSTFYV